MYRNYFYREDLKVELTQLEEEDEKERFLEGSKHKRLIPGYVALEVKENTCKISPVLYPEFRGKGYWKDAENFCWKESLKKDFSQKKTEDVFLTGDRIVSETPRYCPEYGRKAFVSGLETLFTDIRIFFCSGQRQLVR